ncbi:MAG: hypothetical protein PHH83_00990 [Patescibacteria group bacterium]|nr:hypothetical protein [Patescibacteria group bacterium]
MWNKKTIIGLNKAVTIFNPPPNLEDTESLKEFYEFPIELFRGDIVGFNAISDPFWPKYRKELDYFLDNVSKVAKIIVCVTKFKISDELLQKLSKIPNFRLNVSITGLDFIENTKTKDRLDLLKRAKDFNIKAFPIIHPYIAGLSDLSFLKDLKNMGYQQIDVKGLRYNKETMSSWMPEKSKKYYENTQEHEILPEDGWREKISSAGMELKSLKDWYSIDPGQDIHLNEKTAEKYVNKILKYANITSSDSNENVIKASIKRRL